MTIRRIQPGRRYSKAVVCGQLVYLSGIVAADTTGSIERQMQQILEEVDALLSVAGSSKNSLLAATIWLRNIEDFDAMNAVWEEWIPSDALPARATVEARLANPQVRVEIQVTARVEV